MIGNGLLKATWVDGGRKPRNPPNPAYPHGIDLPCPEPVLPHCKIALPYPAPRCGIYVVRCETCGTVVVCTTAGRPDDPRSILVNCKALQ
jgi:hypothetical protein